MKKIRNIKSIRHWSNVCEQPKKLGFWKRDPSPSPRLRNLWKITGLDPGIFWKVEVLPERCDEILIEQYLLSGPTCPVPIKALLGQILVIHFLELFLDHFMCTEE
jgi:hypothetical protein